MLTRCGEVSCCISSPNAKEYSPARCGGVRSPACRTQRVSVLYATFKPCSSASSCCTRATFPRARSNAACNWASVWGGHGAAGTGGVADRSTRRTVLRDTLSSRLISRTL